MARSPQNAKAPATTSTTTLSFSNQAQAASPLTSVASSITNNIPTVPTRTSTRHRTSTSISSSTAPSTPYTPGPLTPVDSHPTTPAGPSRLNPNSKAYVEAKAHQLRSVGEKERSTCPFPDQFGGKARCGVADEDAEDEVLMALAAACAIMDNRALSPDELAAIAFGNGWARAPSAAIEPSTTIMNAIRAHHKRCERADPPRPPLLAKYQLQGSVNESILQPALHPQAFETAVRPKGTVWYLSSTISKIKWKNPFEGIDISKLQVKKPVPIKRKPPPTSLPKMKKYDKEKEKADPVKNKNKPAMPKILLRLTAPSKPEEDESDKDSSRSSSQSRAQSEARSETAPRAASVAPANVDSPHPPMPITMPIRIKRPSSTPRRVNNVLDSSSESDSSDSDVDMITELPVNRVKAKPLRKPPPPPISITGFASSPRNASFQLLRSHSNNSPHTHYEGFLPSPVLPHLPTLTHAHASPFPSHSLDNTTWTVRHDQDHFAQLETSSSSSDDELRDPEWGMASGIIIRGEQGEAGSDGIVWTAAEDEANVKEATDALRVLFPTEREQDVDEEMDSNIELNRLDNRPVFEPSSASGSVIQHHPHGCVKSQESASIPLVAWSRQSSPVASPQLSPTPAPDLSPISPLSQLRNSFEPDEMEVDAPAWLDESGEGPVKSPDDSFEDHLSSVGDHALEREKQNDLFAWAAEAAASSRLTMQIKQEPEDYLSPTGTALGDDELSPAYRNTSRSSSASVESHPRLVLGVVSGSTTMSRSRSHSDSQSPSSGSSELPPFEIDSENASKVGLDLDYEEEEVLCGPESLSIDDLEDGWLPCGISAKDKTPKRRNKKGLGHAARCGEAGGYWGMGLNTIGVGQNPVAFSLPVKSSPKILRKKSARNGVGRRRQSDSTQVLKEEVKIEPLEQVTATITEALKTPKSDARVKEETNPEVDTSRTRRSRSLSSVLSEPPPVAPEEEDQITNSMEIDAIGTEELDKAKAEAEAREEKSRQVAKEKAEKHKLMMDALKKKLTEEEEQASPNSFPRNFHLDNLPSRATGWSEHPCPSPWPDTPQPWGSSSTDSLAVQTPGPLPPSAVLSPHMLQGVAGLSIGDPQTPGFAPYFHMFGMGLSSPNGSGNGVVDPKALISPTFPAMGMGMGPGMVPLGSGMPLSPGGNLNDPALIAQSRQLGYPPPPPPHGNALNFLHSQLDSRHVRAPAPPTAVNGQLPSTRSVPHDTKTDSTSPPLGNTTSKPPPVAKAKNGGAGPVKIVLPRLVPAPPQTDKTSSAPGAAGKIMPSNTLIQAAKSAAASSTPVHANPAAPVSAPLQGHNQVKAAQPSHQAAPVQHAHDVEMGSAPANTSNSIPNAAAPAQVPGTARIGGPAIPTTSTHVSIAPKIPPPAAVSPQPVAGAPISTIPAAAPRPTAPSNTASTGNSATVSSTVAPQPPVVKPAPTRGTNKFIKAMGDGIAACVVDNIPVYQYMADTKKGPIRVLRRLDSDFTNASALLIAFGIPPDKHYDYINSPNALLSSHHSMPVLSPSGIAYDLGVSGVWVRLVEARDMAKRVKNKASERLLNSILKEDLFQIFAVIAGLNSKHSPLDDFGSVFAITLNEEPTSNPSSKTSAASSSSASPAPTTVKSNLATTTESKSAPVALSASAPGSKSVPNLTALASSAPARPIPSLANQGTQIPQSQTATNVAQSTAQNTALAATIKAPNPLIRNAPTAPLEGCPQPKRRRATVVGDSSPLVTSPITASSLSGSAISLTPMEVDAKPGSISASTSPVVSPSTFQHINGPTNGGLIRKVVPKILPLTPAARRATRASVGGEGVAKPKVTR